MYIKDEELYQKLRYLAQVVIPAAGTLYFTIAQIYHLPYAEEIVGTITAIDTFLGVLLNKSSNNYKEVNQNDNE